MPMPVSVDLEADGRDASASSATSSTPRARPRRRSVNFTAFDAEVQRAPGAGGSDRPRSAVGTLGSAVREQLDALGVRGLAEAARRRPRRSDAEVEGRRLELELAGLDLREVQDVVDDRRAARRRRLARRVAYSRCSSSSGGVEEQLGEPDDRVHRRADLVAHRREELRLHDATPQRRVARRRELGGDPLPFGDVTRVHDEAADRRSASRLVAVPSSRIQRPSRWRSRNASPTVSSGLLVDAANASITCFLSRRVQEVGELGADQRRMVRSRGRGPTTGSDTARWHGRRAP